ncbi:hypothetical protein [Dermatophilus congolensis]|uniref:hypothetical protein n=1 Tax=Dermatophilus congolensis TaxID=1863 RepID=UPI001AAE295D|nr:hypothetical protein [Dermatophilus congolensis]MBO3143002.1 hypothetical protein [Dermatophilus congolensis]MBO3151990.1 hypothetical protein [Dermatophilus congolensis]MBO3161001.1 hypothetical protein [Dermatophilus congolensis]MBO3163275.1 hypothetical protein [Dermatophilus congolensis]MBO3176832.1 hypothetical protein [Dermatophilus congolensis]
MGAAMWKTPAVICKVAQLRADGRSVVDLVSEEAYDILTGKTSQHPALPTPEGLVAKVQRILESSELAF